MIGRCVRDDGASLGVPARGGFHTAETVFHLVVGRDYPIMGISLFEMVMLVLVCDETGKPNWLPIGLFEVDIQPLPDGWEFRLDDGMAASGGDALNRSVAMWGYRILVRDPSHSDRLIERDPEALRQFYAELSRRKRISGDGPL